jgi:cytochrome c peroxidase
MTRFAHPLWIGLVVLAGCDGRITSSDPPEPTIDAQLRQDLGRWRVIPMGPMPAQDPSLVALGRALFFDKILSGNRDIACATCHQPAAALGDGLSLSVGTGGTGTGTARAPGPGRELVPRHAPSLLNAGLGLSYMFWDGRLATGGFGGIRTQADSPIPPGVSDGLVAQAMLPVLNRREMRGDSGDTDVFGDSNELALLGDDQHHEIWRAIMRRLLALPEYANMFGATFPDRPLSQLTFEHAARAIAAFQRQAFTKTDSPFDRYLDRNDAALTAEEKRGAALFFGEARCGSCHNGPFLGAQSFANVGAPQIGPGASKEPPLDLGRAELDDFDFYRFAFRVAPLRNVELTPPYMHSGAYPTLEAVVRHYDDVPLAVREYDVSQLAPALRDRYHGDGATIAAILSELDHRLQAPLDFGDREQRDLVAFLRSLTDPAARDLTALIPTSVPSGLPVN